MHIIQEVLASVKGFFLITVNPRQVQAWALVWAAWGGGAGRKREGEELQDSWVGNVPCICSPPWGTWGSLWSPGGRGPVG